MAQEKRTVDAGGLSRRHGVYIARIISHLDPLSKGDLEVEILKTTTSGNDEEAAGQILHVRYLSLFGGQTTVRANSKNEGYANSQMSSGMWFVPPDVGTRVMVVFVEGSINQGYWIGCVPDDYMNFAVPSGNYAATTFNELNNSKKLPVTEYNKLTEKGRSADPTQFIKPVSPQSTVLSSQGLLLDEIRGITSSSARRETPSSVFGISTPGPLDKSPGAPKTAYGPKGAKAQIHSMRLGGSSLVFDDGDDKFLRKGSAKSTKSEYASVEAGDKDGKVGLPMGESIRLRTRTGHQILMHNTEDLIYIGNASGTSWIELSSNGKIDIYARDSISVHTENDLNFTADRDINFQAGREFNLKTASNINLDTAASLRAYVAVDNTITTLGNLDVNTTGANKFTAGKTTDILSGENHTETATEIHMNGPQAATATATTPLSTHKLPQAASGYTPRFPDVATAIADASLSKRLPQHEPWSHHESMDPTVFVDTKTDRTEPEELPAQTVALTVDTFKKGQ